MIVRQTVEAHGGRVDVSSGAGERTRFTVLLSPQPPPD